MTVRYLASALAVSIMALPAVQPAIASCAQFEELSNLGEAAYNAHEFSKAENFYEKALKKVRHCPDSDKLTVATLRHLGESYMREDKYEEAFDTLTRAHRSAHTLGLQEEREKSLADIKELKVQFRRIQPDDLGPTAGGLLKRIGIKYITIEQLKQGQHIAIKFNDKFQKEVTSPNVNRIGLDKTVAFDVIRDNEGNVRLANIRGLRVKTKFWANITEYSVASNSSGEASAAITGKKLGFTKTVSHQMSENALHSARSVMGFWRNMRDTMVKLQDKAYTDETAKDVKAAEEKAAAETAAVAQKAVAETAGAEPAATETAAAGKAAANKTATDKTVAEKTVEGNAAEEKVTASKMPNAPAATDENLTQTETTSAVKSETSPSENSSMSEQEPNTTAAKTENHTN